MKAIFNFNVQIDGFKSIVTLDVQETQGLEVDTLVTLGKIFKGVQTKVNQTLDELYSERMNNETKEETDGDAQELEAPPEEVQVDEPEKHE